MTQSIAIIGAGLMGHGIAHVMAAAGHQVKVFDRSSEALASLPERLDAVSALLDENGEAAQRVQACTTLEQAADNADVVIEAAAEDVHVKRRIVAELEAVVSASTIITSNTSALPITQIALEAQKPERIVGSHFWNPPHLVKLVEVTQAERTSDETVEKTLALFNAAGHHAVHVRQDIAGFIGNRMQHALKREAISLVASGVCDARTVDEVVKRGFGSRLAVLGPLEQSDLVGLDLTRSIHSTLMPAIDVTDSPHPYLEALVADGHLGMSTGKGFYDWTPESATEVRDRLNRFLAQQARMPGDHDADE